MIGIFSGPMSTQPNKSSTRNLDSDWPMTSNYFSQAHIFGVRIPALAASITFFGQNHTFSQEMSTLHEWPFPYGIILAEPMGSFAGPLGRRVSIRKKRSKIFYVQQMAEFLHFLHQKLFSKTDGTKLQFRITKIPLGWSITSRIIMRSPARI